MMDFTALMVDTPRRHSTDDVAFATSAHVEHSGKVAPNRKVAPSANALSMKELALSSFREDPEIKTDADSLLPRLKLLHSFVTHNDGPGPGSPSDSSLLLQLRIGVTSTADSAGSSHFFLAPKKSEQVRRMELAAAAWAAMGRRFQKRNVDLTQGCARSAECPGLDGHARAPSKSGLA